MKVIGLGSPDDLRVRFSASELDVLVDILRDLRAKATRDAGAIYNTGGTQAREIDACHDRLRDVDGLLVQLEEQPPANRPGAILVADTTLMRDIVHEATQEALERLRDAHEHYEQQVAPLARDRLLDATNAARAWIATLTAVDQIDLGWDA